MATVPWRCVAGLLGRRKSARLLGLHAAWRLHSSLAMTITLRPELLTPTPPYVRRLLVGSVIGAASVAIMASGYQARSEEPIAIALHEPADITPPESQLVARETAPPSPSGVVPRPARR